MIFVKINLKILGEFLEILKEHFHEFPHLYLDEQLKQINFKGTFQNNSKILGSFFLRNPGRIPVNILEEFSVEILEVHIAWGNSKKKD